MFHTKYTRIQQICTLLDILAFSVATTLFFASMMLLA